MNFSHRVLLLSFLIVPLLLIACGGGGPEADLDITARILDNYGDARILRIVEFTEGVKYHVLVPEGTPIKHGDEVYQLTDLRNPYQIRIWANRIEEEIEYQGERVKYEALRIDVLDFGGAAAPRR